ncbi:hypothetical protein [Streptosporangium sp. KLBMP 9127]|nr:hypothetical protein [Streptosporangium sp. KLBMP 9127]
MGEFVGIDPAGAAQLIQQMENAKFVLGRTRPGLEAAIAEADAEWAGGQGTAAMHRAWAFFHDSQRELKWRIDTITQVHGGPSGGKLLTAQFPFSGEAQAAAAGKNAGTQIASALSAYQHDNAPKDWLKVEAAMTAAKGGIGDPAYAAALLATLGPVAFQQLFRQWKNVNAAGHDRGLPPAVRERARVSLGVMAGALASADRAKRVGEPWRKELLEKGELDTLSTLVALADQSDTFLNQVGTRLLNLPLMARRAHMSDPDWNTYALMKAYDANPKAFQRLLAEQKNTAFLLLLPDRVKMSGIPDFQPTLAKTLDKALRPGAGDNALRARAWVNLINGLGYEGSHESGGHFDTLKNSPINAVLARNLAPYLGQLASVQAAATSPALVNAVTPGGPWNSVRPDVASRFFGAVMQDPAAVKTLTQTAQNFGRRLDIGRFHPFSSDEAERATYTRLSAQAGGLSNLLLGGSTYAELSDDQYRDFITDIMLLPVDYGVNKYWNIAQPSKATARDYGVDQTKGTMGDLINDYFDDKTPATAEKISEALIDQQVRLVVESLKQHGQRPLTPEDVDQVRQAFRGRLHEALVNALKERGG